jgi:hypothetical protein
MGHPSARVNPEKAKIKGKGSGQECPLYIQSRLILTEN